MTWLPWILLVATLALAGWCSAELGRCLTWARRALLRGQPARRPEGRLVRWLGLDELLRAVETRTSGEGEIRAAAARAGIAISGIHWVLVQTEGMHLTSPDSATRVRTARYFVDLVDF